MRIRRLHPNPPHANAPVHHAQPSPLRAATPHNGASPALQRLQGGSASPQGQAHPLGQVHPQGQSHPQGQTHPPGQPHAQGQTHPPSQAPGVSQPHVDPARPHDPTSPATSPRAEEPSGQGQGAASATGGEAPKSSGAALLGGLKGWMSSLGGEEKAQPDAAPVSGAGTKKDAPASSSDGSSKKEDAAPSTDDAAKKGGWGGWLDRMKDDVKKKSGLLPNEKELADMKFVHDMLAEDKLGGADQTFNQNDVPQIREALMRDPQTARDVSEALADAARTGRTPDGERLGLIKRMAARKGAEGRNGLLGGGAQAQEQAWAQARKQADSELYGALNKEGIRPVEGQGLSSVPRSVSRAEMERFQEAMKSFESYSERVKKSPLAKAVGADKDMRPPHGLSQADVASIMRGEPPKGWIERKD
ncbi:MAG: hypothetical protein EB084_08125 [Proteobacteria bacterium]|nr:hypothetical protein [Pseudomonadota bacterium]